MEETTVEVKARNEMNPEFQWDLTPIFESDEAWRAALDRAEAAVKALSDLPGTLGASADALAKALDRLTDAEQAVERVYGYAFLKKSGDNGDPAAQEMEARAIGLIVQLQTAAAFLEPELLSIDEETLAGWMREETLRPYRHFVDDVTRRRAHTLDDRGERLLAMLGDVAETAGNTFEMFENVDMKLPAVTGEAGEKVQLTHGGFSVLRESRDARVRREAFEAYFGAYRQYINTLAGIYGGAVKMDNFYAEARGYASRLRGGAVRQQRARQPVRRPDRSSARRAAHHAGIPGARRKRRWALRRSTCSTCTPPWWRTWRSTCPTRRPRPW